MEYAATATQQPASTFSVGGVLNRNFSVIRQRFGLLLGIASLPMAFMIILMVAIFGLFSRSAPVVQAGTPPAASFMWITMGAMFFVFLFSFVVQGAFSYAVFQTLAGKRATFAESLFRGLKRIIPIGLTAFITLIAFYIGFLLLIIPGIFLLCCWIVVIPACAVEKLGPIQSIGRSFSLTSGCRLQILGLLALLFLMYIVFIIAFSFIVQPLLHAIVPGLVFSIVISIFQLFIYGVVTMYFYGIIAVTYHDLRVVKEGISSLSLANVFA